VGGEEVKGGVEIGDIRDRLGKKLKNGGYAGRKSGERKMCLWSPP